jgi:hypothetical protein
MPAFRINDGEVTMVGLWHGTVIKMNDGKRFKVTKLNPKNIKMMDENGRDGYGLNRAYAETLIDEDQSWEAPQPKSEYEKYRELLDAGVTLGTKVKITDPRLHKYRGPEYVVIALPNNGTMRLAKLGGDGGKYLKNIELENVEVIPV